MRANPKSPRKLRKEIERFRLENSYFFALQCRSLSFKQFLYASAQTCCVRLHMRELASPAELYVDTLWAAHFLFQHILGMLALHKRLKSTATKTLRISLSLSSRQTNCTSCLLQLAPKNCRLHALLQHWYAMPRAIYIHIHVYVRACVRAYMCIYMWACVRVCVKCHCCEREPLRCSLLPLNLLYDDAYIQR